MKRIVLAILLAVIMTVSLLTVGAAAVDDVSYIDANGTPAERDGVTAVTTETTGWTEGWYVVNSNVTIETRITVTGDVHLILADGCTLNAAKGIYVGSGNSLTIYGQSEGTGKLTAQAYQVGESAGIGGNTENDAAHGNITINGGVVEATSYGGAGIGSGSGSGTSAKPNGTITINGGNVTAIANVSDGAGIGGGFFNNITGGNIKITGGTVVANGAANAAGIGTGYNDQRTTNGRSITISGGKVTATGGEDAAGIGGGYAVDGKSISSITINGTANVTANGGAAGAGIGGGRDGEMTTNINIGGSAVVVATGGDDDGYGGAGIGTGGGTSSKIGNININGGTVTATGGTATDSSMYSGAGIGSGGNSKIVDFEGGQPYVKPATGEITINAGTITATGGKGAAGIGDGANGKGGDFVTDRTVNGATVSGKAIIYASSITDSDDTDAWDGIIFQGNDGQVYGTIALNNGLTLEEGQTLTVPAGSKLIVPKEEALVVKEGAELIILENGNLANNGTVISNGTLTSTGTISGSGTFTGDGTEGVNFAAEFNGTKYAALNAAIKAANNAENGGTVTLLKNVTISSTTEKMADNVTLSVDSGKTLTVKNVTKLTGGALEIKADGGLKLGADMLVGTGGVVELTEGTATLDFNNVDAEANAFVSLTLDGTASMASGLKALWVTADSANSFVPMAITVASGSKATVSNGGVLNLVNGSSLTVADDATFTVEGILEVHSTAKFASKATVSGKVYVFKSSEGTNPIAGANITLTKTGVVYSEESELTETSITPARMTASEEKYASTSTPTSKTDFAKQWTLSYKVTLNANGGTLAGSSVLWTDSNGNLEAQPDAPTWTGHTFSGWDSDGDDTVDFRPGDIITNISEDLELNAVWDVIICTVSFDSDGGSAVATKYVEHGSKVTKPADPTKANYTFVGWYNGETLYDFDTPVTSDITLKAVWKLNEYTVSFNTAGGSTVPSKTVEHGKTTNLPSAPSKPGYIFLGWRNGNVTYGAGDPVVVTSDMTFYAVWANMPDVTPGDDPDEPVVAFPFNDVSVLDWFYDAVYYVWENELMNGTDVNQFSPNSPLTRAMVWAVLARVDGETISGDSWMTEAQAWAVESGVSDGTNPMGYVTREQLVTMLYRFAGEPAGAADISGYPDAASISDWAADAMAWAVKVGLIEGDDVGALNPTANSTRAHAATFFMRFSKTIL